jgi:pyruvate,orthophosphate dikinase
MSASPGAAVGKIVFDSEAAVAAGRAGKPVILVRRETNPDDLPGMVAAAGILTSRGGKTSHAAVVARGMGKTCVCGAERSRSTPSTRTFTTPDGTVVAREVISIDGSTGEVFDGEVRYGPRPSSSTSRASTLPRRGRGPLDLVRRGPHHAIADETRRCWCGPTPTPRRTPPAPAASAPGHRPVPHRAHVPRRPRSTWRS